MKTLRERLSIELQSIPGLAVYPGAANFLFVRIDRKDIDAPTLARKMLTDGIAIRNCDNYDGLDARFFRVAVRTAEENALLCQSIGKAFGGIPSKPGKQRKTPGHHVSGDQLQCRQERPDGGYCAAFSCRTATGWRRSSPRTCRSIPSSPATGEEMGRAQVVQAQACRLDPDVRMNPILLKPSSDTGAQVIVWGQPVGNMDVSQYIRLQNRGLCQGEGCLCLAWPGA